MDPFDLMIIVTMATMGGGILGGVFGYSAGAAWGWSRGRRISAQKR